MDNIKNDLVESIANDYLVIVEESNLVRKLLFTKWFIRKYIISGILDRQYTEHTHFDSPMDILLLLGKN